MHTILKFSLISFVIANIALFSTISAEASIFGIDSIGTVNGTELSKSKFESNFKKAQAVYKEKMSLDLNKLENASIANQVKVEILNSLIKYNLIVNEATARGIKTSDDEVNKQVSLLRDQYKAQGQDLEKALKEQGLTEKDLRTQIKDSYMIKKFEQTFIDEETVSQAEIEKFYNKPENAKFFNHGETAHAAHILIMADEKKLSAAEMKAKKDKAQGLLDKALKGEDFANLAINNSEDPGSKGSGGDLGYFDKGKMVPEFEKACFEGKPGVVYPQLVKTTYGFHIIKVIDRKSAGKTSLSEVSGQISNFIKVNKAKEAMAIWYKDAYNKAKIEIKPDYKQYFIPNPKL